jgi:PAS domain S-box-containing protein
LISNKINTLEQQYHKLIDSVFRIFSIIGVLIIPTLIYRSGYLFGLENLIPYIAIGIILLTYFFRNKILLKIKVYILVFIITLVFSNGLFNFGFLVSSKIYILLAPIFIVFILSYKKALQVLIVLFIIYVISAYLYTTGYWTHNFDANTHVTKPVTWLLDGLILLASSYALLYIGKANKEFNSKNFAELELRAINLQDREERYRGLFESAELSILIIKDDIIIDCNESTLKLFKCDRDYLIGKRPSEVSPDFQPDGEFSIVKGNTINNLVFNEKFRSLEWRHKRPNGELFDVSATLNPLKLSKGTFMQAVLQDITESKKIRVELKKHQNNLEKLIFDRTKELEESLEREKELGILKTRFVSMASHEFRTPLTSINAAADIILNYADKLSKEDIEKRLYKIKNEVVEITTTLEDILVLGKAESQKLKFETVEINIVDVIKSIVFEYQISAETPREVDWNILQNKILVIADPKWIKKIVLNLIHNAVKYSKPNSKIKINILSENNYAVFSVSNEGIGITEKDQKNIFEPFHRGENVNQISGTGLGLTVTKKAVDLHKGKIKVVSKMNETTTFIVSIPI